MAKTLKKIGKVLLIILIVIAVICAGVLVYCEAIATNTSLTVKVDTEEKLREFYGWGTSNCWWADDIDDEQTRNEIADLLFSEDGLNLDTFRYCLYGGYDEDNNRVNNEWRLGESFYYYNEESGEFEYDFTRDANAQAMLDAALERGVDNVILFANSPHYSMCINGQTSGSENNDGKECNIDESRYQDYADYFLTITEYFIEKGVPVKYISPINEPQWGWGGDYVSQEGCHYEVDEAVALLKVFAQSIKERGLDVKLCAPESGNIIMSATKYYKQLSEDEDIADVLGEFSTHSYSFDYDQIVKMWFGNWADKNMEVPLDASEWCELPCVNDTTSVKGACRMARVISKDIGYENCNTWSNWVAINEQSIHDDGLDYSDGLISANSADMSDYTLSYRYYAYMQYSKFIPEGSYVLDCGNNGFTIKYKKTAFLTPSGDVVAVVVNEGNDRNLKFELEGYTDVTIYTTDEEHKCEETYSGECRDKYEITKDSVNTFVFTK